jgi:MFS family permease
MKRRLALLRPLAIRDFALLWSGMTISLLGDGVFFVALAWQTYSLSNRPTAMSFVGVAYVLPQVLLLLLGGVLSDRVERRRMMMLSDLLRGAAVAVTSALALGGVLELWHLVAAVVVFGAGDALFAPAFGAIVPEIVPAEQLVEANSLDQFVRPAVRLVGPALGGALVAGLGAGYAFLFEAVTFGCSFTALALMQARPHPPREGPRSMLGEIAAGYRYARSKTWLWGTLVAAAIGNVAGAAPYILVPYIVKNLIHGSAGDLGLVLSSGAVGALGASLVLGQVGLPRRHIVLMFTAWGFAGLVVVGWAAADTIWQGMLISFASGAGAAAGHVVWGTLMHTLVPRELLGRVTSLDWLVSISLVPLWYAVVGVVAQAIGARETMLGVGLLSGCTIFALFLPGIRDTERDGSMPHRLSAAAKETAPVA